MQRILVTGALGQIGTELTAALRHAHGDDLVVASDINEPSDSPPAGPFEKADCTKIEQLRRVVERYDVGTVYHLAALLSATGEKYPLKAWEVNAGGLLNVLELAREHGCSVFTPSSIAAFGDSSPKVKTPQDTLQRPSTMYGITKVAGELLCDYYHQAFGVDTRGVRFPGLISWAAQPGGGTTDYAVDIFYAALEKGSYTCFLKPGTRLDMMYMPDAIKAATRLMQADPERLEHRNAFNVTAMSFTPAELAAAIAGHVPGFEIDYDVDDMRQSIADSWPDRLDDSAAREEWGWSPDYDLDSMVTDMLTNLRRKLAC